MSFQRTTTAEGCPVLYTLNPEIKRYTLLDNGFQKTPSDQFQLIRSLDPDLSKDKTIHMKIVVNDTLDGFKLSVLNPSGLRQMNIFKNKNETAQQLFYQWMDQLVFEGCFLKQES